MRKPILVRGIHRCTGVYLERGGGVPGESPSVRGVVIFTYFGLVSLPSYVPSTVDTHSDDRDVMLRTRFLGLVGERTGLAYLNDLTKGKVGRVCRSHGK